MIPKYIHQTWKNKNLPEKFRTWSDSFKELNPDFKFFLYTDEDNLSIVRAYGGKVLDQYLGFEREIYRVDLVRAFYLFLYGGFYIDLDFQCLNSFCSYTSKNKLIFGYMGYDRTFEHSIPNALMASPKYSGFWIHYLRCVMERDLILRAQKTSLEPEFLTGPVMLKSSIQSYIADFQNSKALVEKFIEDYEIKVNLDNITYHEIHMLEASVWYPLNWNDMKHQKLRVKLLNSENVLTLAEAKRCFPNSDAVTYWAHSWPGFDIGLNVYVQEMFE